MNQLQINKLIKSCQSRYMQAYYCQDKKEALAKALSLIDKEKDLISWGGSMTLKQIGLIQYFNEHGYKTVDREKGKSTQEINDLLFKSRFSTTFLSSANAISLDGQIVNIDGTSNRIANIAYGPTNVIIIVGVNKIVSDLHAALERASQVAAVKNCQRLNELRNKTMDAACLKVGKCTKCVNKDCICANTLITRLSKPQDKIKIIIVNEDLGL